MSLKTCKAKVRSGYIPFSSLFSIYPDTGSMLLEPANIKVQFIIFMVTSGGDWWLANCSIINGWWALFLFALSWNKQQAEDLYAHFAWPIGELLNFLILPFETQNSVSFFAGKKKNKCQSSESQSLLHPLRWNTKQILPICEIRYKHLMTFRKLFTASLAT